jgi:hypothetical protein
MSGAAGGTYHAWASFSAIRDPAGCYYMLTVQRKNADGSKTVVQKLDHRLLCSQSGPSYSLDASSQVGKFRARVQIYQAATGGAPLKPGPALSPWLRLPLP